MHVIIDNLHREYFNTQGQISFEEVFPLETITLIRQEIQQILAARSKKKLTDQEAYQLGHDLFRDSPVLKKLLDHRLLGHMTAELTEQKPVRLGFDQLFKETSPKPQVLKDICSIQGLLLGVVIDLNEESLGGVLFLSPDKPLPEDLGEALLIGYIGPESVYVHREKDPHTNELKKLGYGFGDRLTHTTHPAVYR